MLIERYDPVLAGIVSIRDKFKRIVGTGFIVVLAHNPHQVLIATSTQVVEVATGLPIEEAQQKSVHIGFHSVTTRETWEASIAYWSSPSQDNISILCVNEEIPDRVRSLRLSLATRTEGQKVSIFGYPDVNDFEGAWRYCDICRLGPKQTKIGTFSLQLESKTMNERYGGAPLWDEAKRRVIGMVKRAGHEDSYVHAVPVETLRAICKEIDIKDQPPSHYHGVKPFTEDEAASFFGYDKITDRLVQQLNDDHSRVHGFLAVFGPEGSGKSSVIQAGLLPRLRHGEVRGEKDWGVFRTQIVDKPFEQLEAEGLEGATIRLSQGIHNWSQRHGQRNVILILDQFEKFLTQAPQDIQVQFIEQLIQVIAEGAATVILAVKDEFYNLLAKHEKLMEFVEANLINVYAPATKEAYLEIAIERADLPGAIKDLRVAEHAIDKIFQAKIAISSSPILRLEVLQTQIQKTLQHIEGSKGAEALMDELIETMPDNLNALAEHIYGDLDEQKKIIARKIFIALVLPANEDRPIDMGNPVLVDSLCHDETEYYDMIDILADAGLLETGRDRYSNEATVQIAQDALIREWQRLREWLQEERDFVQWQQSLQEHTNAKISNEIDVTSKNSEWMPLDDFELAEAEMWLKKRPADLDQEYQHFIQSSRQKNKREIYAVLEDVKTKQEEGERRYQKLLARRLIDKANELYDHSPHLLQQAVLLAAQALERAPHPEADEALRRGLALLPRPVTSISAQTDIHVVAFSHNGHYVAIATTMVVEIADLRTGQISISFPQKAKVIAMAFNPDGTYLVTTDISGCVQQCFITDGQQKILYRDMPGTAIEFSPNERHLAIAHGDGKVGNIKLWDIRKNEWHHAGNLQYGASIKALAFSPDGKYLATGYSDNAVQLWMITRQKVHGRIELSGSVRIVVFSPGGHYLATADDTATICVWDVDSIMLPDNFEKESLLAYAHSGEIHAVLFNHQGDCIASASADQTVKVCRVGEEEQLLPISHAGKVFDLAWSVDDSYLATASEDHSACVWDMNKARLAARLTHESGVYRVAFSMEKNYLFTASTDRSIKVWDLAESMQHKSFHHPATVHGVTWSPRANDFSFVTACDDYITRIWTFGAGYRQSVLPLEHKSVVWSAAYSPDGHYLATVSRDTTAGLWDVVHTKKIAALQHSNSVYSVVFSPDGRFVATGSKDRTAKIWNELDGCERARLDHRSAVNVIAFSSDSRFLATGSCNGEVSLWEWETSNPVELISPMHAKSVNSIAFSLDGRYLIVASDDNCARIWEWKENRARLSFDLPHKDHVYTANFSPDGRYIATASADGNGYIWQASNGSLLCTLPHKNKVWAIRFSPDGRYVATGSSDCSVGIWETTTGYQIARLPHPNSVFTIAFSFDGKYLLTGCRGGMVGVWLWRPEDLVSEVCSRVTRDLTREEWEQYVENESYRKLCDRLRLG